MTTVTVTTRVTHKYLMHKTKDELIDMIFWLMDMTDKLRNAVEPCVEQTEGGPIPLPKADTSEEQANLCRHCTSEFTCSSAMDGTLKCHYYSPAPKLSD